MHSSFPGLSMVHDETKANSDSVGVKWFKFEHNVQYQTAQKLFWEAVDTHSPDALAVLYVVVLYRHGHTIHNITALVHNPCFFVLVSST